jgi:arylsulfatase A-like enzyme
MPMVTNFTRRQFVTYGGLASLSAVTAAPAGSARSGASARRPNIIILLTDDQRWDTLGCMGNPVIRTPNLDRLATDGVLFLNNFCTTSICMASRASIFTGLYKRSHKVDTFEQPLAEPLFAKSYPALVRTAGYRTGFIGKWGLGGALPESAFDYFDGFPGQGKYFHEQDGTVVHLTKLMTGRAVEFLEGCSREQPFCLSVSFKAPHVQDNDPRQFLYDPAFEDLYRDVMIPTPKTAAQEYYEALPEFLKNTEGRRRWQRRFATPEQFQSSLKGYYRLVSGVDLAVGRIRATLEELGLNENTVILFTSDNGFFLGERGLAGKWLMYEESIRTPLIIHDARLPATMRGRRLTEMVLNIDVAPTVLDLAGIDIPPGVQGRSLVPLVTGRTVPWRTDWFYEHDFGTEELFPAVEGIRTERWKYARYVRRDPVLEQLYDLTNDPHEEHDLAGQEQHKDVLERLRNHWATWRDHLDRWQPNGSEPWHDPRY